MTVISFIIIYGAINVCLTLILGIISKYIKHSIEELSVGFVFVMWFTFFPIYLIHLWIAWYKIKPFKNKEFGTINLNSPVQLRTSRYKYGGFLVEFYNPYVNQWWVIPSMEAAIHGKWGFNRLGDYGAYSLNVYIVRGHDPKPFETLNDIQKHFDRMNKEYDEFKEYQEKMSIPPSW